MAVLKLKPNPTFDALLKLRPPIRIKEFLIKNSNNPYNEFDKIRRQKILDYVERQQQAKRTVEEKGNDFEEIIKEPDSKWERWWWREKERDGYDNKVIEEWQPWSRIDGEAINIWRIYKK